MDSSIDYGKALSEMWALGGKAFLETQQQALRALREGAAAMGLPTEGLPTGGLPTGGLPAAAMPGAGLPGAALPGAALPGLAPPLPGFPKLGFDAGEIGKAGQALAGLWTSASELAGALARRLPQGGAADAAAAAQAGGAESTVAATLRRMIDPRVWLSAGDDMEEALQRMAQGPRFADLWDSERRFAQVFGAWMTLRRRSLEHQGVVLEGWVTAARRFAERLGERAAQGAAAAQGGEAAAAAPPLSQRAALDLWIETANRALLAMQRSERYLDSQAQLLKASTELRLAQQAVAEHYGQMFGLPTRTELDDVHRTVTELRRALRATERRLRQQQATAAAKKPAPERPTPERPTPERPAAATLRAARPAARRGGGGKKAEG